ncbi:MAG: glycosyltransferase family 39 protein [Acidobacteriales bacterium]|nr:glycosyltransferase family 39 protein [Terriglobales bacterium]
MRRNLGWFGVVTAAGIALRLFFLLSFPLLTPDTFFYGDIAKNLLQHGVYGVSAAGGVAPTYIRVPGYPGFLAAVFTVFGMEHYRAVLVIQLCFDIGTCFVTADLVRRTVGDRGAKIAFLLVSLCPFLANYVAAGLTETLEIFFTVLALDAAVIGFDQLRSRPARYRGWVLCGTASGCAILLRPDGAILLAALGLYLGLRGARELLRRQNGAKRILRAGLLCGGVAVAPLVPWTLRNLYTMHRFQPLAPRYANDPGEVVPTGFQRWSRTWVAEYVSTEEVYWPMPGEHIDPGKLPRRAFDSEAERQQTMNVLATYNQQLAFDPALDAQFEQLAEQRIRAAPLRYYLWLPSLRILDMWARPRTELLPIQSRWWEFDDEPHWIAAAVILGALNLLYIGSALSGALWGSKVRFAGLFGLFVLLRSAFLGTLENPEPRYTLECYPIIILFAAALLVGRRPAGRRLV